MTTDTIKSLARQAGFDLAGVTSAEPTVEWLFYPQWVRSGFAGEMGYLTDHRAAMRQDPRSLLPSARSLICLGLVYNTPDPYSVDVDADGQGWVSRYAWGRDYHLVLKERLAQLAAAIEARTGPFEWKSCVDTAPLLERAYAHHAGLGWIGKNTCLINQQVGSWVFLGELITSLELVADDPAPFRCGTCTRCIDACPTDALIPTHLEDGPEYALDSRRCISYWTIELRGPIPEQNREEIGRHVFGCDICQDVCPWNRRAATTQGEEFHPENQLPALEDLASMTREEFNQRFRGTPIERTRYRGFLRNAAVAMGNSGNPGFLDALRRMSAHEDPVIREHAAWAVEQIERTLAGRNPEPAGKLDPR